MVSVLLAEMAIRFIEPPKPDRCLMYSSRTFHLDSSNAVRYLPNENIRTVATYNRRIEYDVTFRTNNLGFVDQKDYIYQTLPNKTCYAFVGDSFTAGYHGGQPWVPTLRDKIQDKNENIEIYNLGVEATGLEHFYRLLKSVTREIRITHIVILAISSDFLRPFSYPITTTNEIRFCPENLQISRCMETYYTAKVMQYEATNEEILILSDQMSEDKARYESRENFMERIRENSRLVGRAAKAWGDLSWSRRRKFYINSYLVPLVKIKNAFPMAKICLIHLPQKNEVETNRYELDIRKEIQDIGIEYFSTLAECSWSLDMFFPNDGHPNGLGYRNISNCVSNILFH
jgi:hypothetical protein